MTKDNMEKIKEKFNRDDGIIRPEDSRVIIAEMQLNALMKMSEDTNEVFSQIDKSEVFDVSRAIMFSRSALPSITERLHKRGINHIFSLPILEGFIQENFRNLHKVDRKRTGEYLEGLKAIAPKNGFVQDEPPKRSLLQKLV
jgi:CMP-2-keto-3-deoxyoctulosonic acid synthetase